MKEDLVALENLNLTYNFGESNAFQALHDIDVKIKEGDFAVVLGPSGCGKSSLLNIIAGLELPESGSVLVKDKDLLQLKEDDRVRYHRREVGMIFQAYNLIPTLNVLDNVALPQIFINKRKRDRDQKSLNILKKLGISNHAYKIPTELSGGQQQRIGIARSIINDPQIVLADEPVGNLDSVSSNNVMEILTKLNTEENKTIIMVTHNSEHASWGNRVIHMLDGKITKIEVKDREGNVEKQDREKHLSGFDRFVNRFRGLSQKQIKELLNPYKAKHLTERLTTHFEAGQIELMEQKMRSRLSGKMDSNQLQQELDQPKDKGGVGLDARSAESFSQEVETLLTVAQKSSQESDLSKQASIILKTIFKFKNYKIDEKSLNRAVELLTKKLDEGFEQDEFEKLLGQPLSKKGAGLDKRIIGDISELINLIQIISYGLK